jgi:aryl-alcohol dehydrogenase-like predicted oxidoreductase
MSKQLIIGTAQFGMSYGIANAVGKVRFSEVARILDLAWSSGICTLDTAKSYGASESVIGCYLQQRRHCSWSVITKLSDKNNGVSCQIDDSQDKLMIQAKAVLAHSSDLYVDCWFQEGMKKAKNEGKVEQIGVSLYSEDEIVRVMDSTLTPDIIQLPINLLDTRLYRSGTLRALSNSGVEVHARSVFLQGMFFLAEKQLTRRFTGALPYISELTAIASKVGLTLAELSLLWLTGLQEVTKVVIGVDDVVQLESHLATLKKSTSPPAFEEAVSVACEDKHILDPRLWEPAC